MRAQGAAPGAGFRVDFARRLRILSRIAVATNGETGPAVLKMGKMGKNEWQGAVQPMAPRPVRQQVAALCYRRKDDRKQVLLITSRDTGRWVIPKGWPMPDCSDARAALREAWEEAGVTGRLTAHRPIGHYRYVKLLKDGAPVAVETDVYPVRVKGLAAKYPEAGQRRRKWVSPRKAAKMVQEPQLKALLMSL